MGGCVAAMQSAGIQNYKQLTVKENRVTTDLQYTEQLLQTASYYGMNRSLSVLGDFYLDCLPKRDVGKAIGCYREALKIKKDGGIYYRLGLLSSSQSEKTIILNAQWTQEMQMRRISMYYANSDAPHRARIEGNCAGQLMYFLSISLK